MEAHSVPLFDASAFFSLNGAMCHCEYYESLVGMYLVLSLVPSPHVAEQAVHDPHGPTSQSTESKRVGTFFSSVLLYNLHTRGVANHIAGPCFCELNNPVLEPCAFLSIILGM